MEQKKEQIATLIIGNFDGIHLGHQELLKQAWQLKIKDGVKSVLLTFDPHPADFLAKAAPPLLTTKEEKTLLLKYWFGVTEVVFLPFDAKMANLTPEEFVEQYIFQYYSLKNIIVGFNFHFGKDGSGDAKLLSQIAASHGANCTIVTPVEDNNGNIISSTAIRKSLQDGNLDQANAMLGYWYNICGKVIHGNEFGRTIGFPTANIAFPEGKVVPKYGVYAVVCSFFGQAWTGVANIGYRPTIDENCKALLLETNVLTDIDLPLYNEQMRVFLGKYIRPEQKFDSIQQLKEQIAKDKAAAEQFIDELPDNSHLPKFFK